jgi:hypothetical protein
VKNKKLSVDVFTSCSSCQNIRRRAGTWIDAVTDLSLFSKSKI